MGGVTALTLAAWWLSDWQVWPWLGAVGVMLLLGVTGAARRVGLAWTLAACLAVVALWLLLVYVSPWWWLLLAGVVLLVAAVTAAAVLRLRERRAQTLAALGIGLAMVAGGAVGLGVTAAEHERQEQAALDQQHQTSVARILPRTPGSMVNFLVEKIAYPTPDAVTSACFVFAPPAQAQLAGSLRVADCPAAVRALAAKVIDAHDYANNVWLPGQAVTRGPAGTVVDACHLTFDALTDDTPHPNAGPQLGRLTLQQQQGEGSLIVAYQRCR